MEFYRVSEAAAAAITAAGGQVTGECGDQVVFPAGTTFMDDDVSERLVWVDMPGGVTLNIVTEHADVVSGGFAYVYRAGVRGLE